MNEFLPLWHVTHRRDWDQARREGVYLHSTRGATLGEQGFIHCCYPHQLGLVAREVFAGDDQELVVLEIDRDRLGGSKVRVESAPGSTMAFPHLYGPLPTDAVVQVRAVALDADGLVAFGDVEDLGDPQDDAGLAEG